MLLLDAKCLEEGLVICKDHFFLDAKCCTGIPVQINWPCCTCVPDARLGCVPDARLGCVPDARLGCVSQVRC